eukprot:60754-Chlamydomonas_euryale.AAC.3
MSIDRTWRTTKPRPRSSKTVSTTSSSGAAVPPYCRSPAAPTFRQPESPLAHGASARAQPAPPPPGPMALRPAAAHETTSPAAALRPSAAPSPPRRSRMLAPACHDDVRLPPGWLSALAPTAPSSQPPDGRATPQPQRPPLAVVAGGPAAPPSPPFCTAASSARLAAVAERWRRWCAIAAGIAAADVAADAAAGVDSVLSTSWSSP